MANGSSTLTINQSNCPGNSAANADLGKSIYVLTAGTWGAGCGSGALKATIIGVTPPNQFTLSANACQAVSNGAAFYGTDNTAAWNAYMQSTNPTSPFAAQLGGTSNGRMVHLPAGAYLVDTTSGGSLYTRRGMSVRGDRQTLTALWDMGTGTNSTIKMCSSTSGVDTGGSTCEIDGLWVATPFGGANAICVDDNGADVNFVEHMWFSCTGTGLKLTQGGTFVENNTWDQGTRIAALFVGNGNPASTNPFGSVNSIGNLIYATSVGGYVLQGVGSFNSVGDIFVANKCYDIEVNSGAYGWCVDAPAAAGNTSYNVVVTGDRFQASTTAGYFAPQETHIRILTPLANSSITSSSFSESHETDIYGGAHGQIEGLTIGPANTFLNDTSQGTSSIAIQYTDSSPSFGFAVKDNIWNSPACWALDSTYRKNKNPVQPDAWEGRAEAPSGGRGSAQ